MKASGRIIGPLSMLFCSVLFCSGAATLGLPAGASDDLCPAGAVAWSPASITVTVSGAVDCTLTDIARHTTAPVTVAGTDVRVWSVDANVTLARGATLRLHGRAAGGDADEVRLRSVDSARAGSIVTLKAEWGTIDMRSTRVTSWSPQSAAPDTEHATFGRASIRVRSFLDGSTPRESRMDIADSDVGYLGWANTESYGLTWKVAGSPSPGLYDQVGVYGEVTGSRLHHNYFGAYTYGGQDIVFQDNEVDYNAQYGIDPHDDSDGLLIAGNFVHDNGNHGIICSQRCDHLMIRDNQVEANTGNGIMLHRSVTDSVVADNQVTDNTDAGVALFESHRNTVAGNRLLRNRRGVRLSVGSSDNIIEGNDIDDSSQHGIYTYAGSDAPVSGDGRIRRNRFSDNVLSDSAGQAVMLTDAEDNTFEATRFAGSTSGVRLERSTRNRFSGNDFSALSVLSALGAGTPVLNTVDAASAVSLGFDSAATWAVADPGGRVSLLPGGLATSITPSGSRAELAATVATSPARVEPLAFNATVTSGSARVVPGRWLAEQRDWTTMAAAGQSVHYILGGLVPARSYEVRRAGSLLGTFRAGAAGTVAFGSAPGSSAAVTYALAPAAAAPATFAAEADAEVRADNPTSNYGSSSSLRVDSSPLSAAYLRFKVTGAPGPVGKAVLRLYVTDSTGNGPALYPVASTWSEAGITWRSRPGRTGGLIADLGRMSSGSWVEYDVTRAVAGDGTWSFELAATSTDGVAFRSSEASSRPPQLVVTHGTLS